MAERPGELNQEIQIDDDEITSLTESNDFRTTNGKYVEDVDETATKVETVSDDPEKIRANIEETRSEMSETIDAIQEKLSFSNISEQVKTEVSEYVGETIQTAKNTVYDATIAKVENIMKYTGKAVNEFGKSETAKSLSQNPIALGLIGLGIGLIFLGNKKKTLSRNIRQHHDHSANEQSENRNFASRSNQSTFSAAHDKISEAAGNIGDTVSSAAGTVSDSFGSAAGVVSDTVGDVAGKAYKQVGNIGSKAQDFAGTAQDQYEYYMEENPLAVGAVALALGAAVGFAFPSTRIESRYMGEARNNLLQKAEATARDAVGQVQMAAGQITQTVKEEVKNQGLS